jgi:hypothetical protein
MKRYFSLALLIFVVFIVSCYYDNKEALYPVYDSTCDSTNVTFTITIAPILNNNCTGCHNGAPGGSFSLASIAAVKTKATAITAAINYTGKSPMPPDGKLKNCSINQFEIWVRKGMPN